MIGIEIELNFNPRNLRCREGLFHIDEMRRCRPCEIMNILGVELIGFHALVCHGRFHRKTSRSYSVIGRHLNFYVIHAKVGIELRISVVLMQIPARLGASSCTLTFISGYFRKPLPCHNKVIHISHAGKSCGQLHKELRADGHLFS
ncbi:hypothetical protein D3C85_837880 [compost metagenome]